MGWALTSRKVLEVLALVWAGSQVTKLVRAGAALACAPLADKVLNFAADKLGCSRQQAFVGMTCGAFALGFSVFGLVALAWS